MVKYMKQCGLIITLAALLLASACGGAAPGTSGPPAVRFKGELDTTFGTAGVTTFDLGSTTEEVHGMAVQPDGKIVVVGNTWPEGERGPKFVVARLNADGSLDSTFADGGKAITRLIDDLDYAGATAVALQTDGKIVAAGRGIEAVEHQSAFTLVRYNGDGTLDETFGAGGKVQTIMSAEPGVWNSDEANALAIGADGKIVVAGFAGRYATDFAVARYNADGSLDSSFGAGGKVLTDVGEYDKGNAVRIQPDGKIVVGGYATVGSGSSEFNDFVLLRYNVDGSPDSGFGDGGKVVTDMSEGEEDWGYGLELLPDGKIVLAGLAYAGGQFCGTSACKKFGFALAQYTPDGKLDTSFGDGGKAINAEYISAGYALARLPDGRLVVAGHRDNYNLGLALFNPNGSPVADFGASGTLSTDFARGTDRIYALAALPDGSLLAAGTIVPDSVNYSNGDFAIVRYK